MRLIIVLTALLATCGADDCSPRRRDLSEARSQAMLLLRSSVVCEGDKDAGYVCVDNKGGMVGCPARFTEPCKLAAGKPEAPGP